MTATAQTGSSGRQWPLAIVYLAIGLGLYSRILGTFFVADDFAYLDAIVQAKSPAVIFSPLAERYFRPAVVFVYYVNYQLSALSPWTYHVSVVLMHVVNAWLVFLLGRGLAPVNSPFVPALAGLLFLVFGGHAEAVTWIGGMADPLVTMFLLLGLVLFQRALDAARPVPLFAGTWLAFAAALLTKESSAVFLGFAVAFAALAKPGLPDRRRIRLAAGAVAVPVLLLALYFVTRRLILGFAFVDLEGLGTSRNLLGTARAFVLRSFFPQGPVVVRIWNQMLDLYVLVPVVLALVWFARRRDYQPLALLTLCFGLALAPVLPLSIAIARPESERFIYLPSAFACLLLVWLLDSALRRRWLVSIVVGICCVGHAAALDRINRLWVEAAAITRGFTSSFRELMREHGRPGRPVYVLNVPDSVSGAFVYRRGFHDSLRVVASDQLDKMAQTHVLSVYTVVNPAAPARATPAAAGVFELELGGGELLGTVPPPGPFFSVDRWTTHGFRARFGPSAGPGLVVYFSPREARLAGTLPGGGVPFGVVDLPAERTPCTGDAVTIAGWALDYDGIERVTVAVLSPDGKPAVDPGIATRYVRPDVAAAYPGFPDSALAGWTYALPCTAVIAHARDGSVVVVVAAVDRTGARAEIGGRTIVLPR
jgi:hypothetical protein